MALRDEAAELLDAVCEDDDDWDAAEAAAIDVSSTAYDEYFETLEDIGVKPKPSAEGAFRAGAGRWDDASYCGRTVATTSSRDIGYRVRDSLSRGHRRCRRCRVVGCRLALTRL